MHLKNSLPYYVETKKTHKILEINQKFINLAVRI